MSHLSPQRLVRQSHGQGTIRGGRASHLCVNVTCTAASLSFVQADGRARNAAFEPDQRRT